MTTSFKDLKSNRAAEIEKLTQKLKDLNGNQFKEDERFWQPLVDKAGNGSAVIRFLPAPKGEDVPFIRIFKHGFQHPGTGFWYIENSLTTLGRDDPVAEYNTKLWNSTTDSESPARKQASKQKRNLVFTSNIEVVKHAARPEDEGKVFLYNYGKKIFTKLNDKMNPPEGLDETPFNPFDFWEGANFKLVIAKVDGQRNYDKSEFQTPKPLSSKDDELEKIWESEYSLQALLDEKNFKSYEDLSKNLNRVLGNTTSRVSEEVAEPVSRTRTETVTKTLEPTATPDEDFENELSMFKKLAEED